MLAAAVPNAGYKLRVSVSRSSTALSASIIVFAVRPREDSILTALAKATQREFSARALAHDIRHAFDLIFASGAAVMLQRQLTEEPDLILLRQRRVVVRPIHRGLLLIRARALCGDISAARIRIISVMPDIVRTVEARS
jgi:hypothetical protein